jgi:hypothetical protein
MRMRNNAEEVITFVPPIEQTLLLGHQHST